MQPRFFPFDINVIWDDAISLPVFIDSEGISHTCEEGEENHWSVYVHRKDGGLICVADLPTKKSALDLEELLANASKFHLVVTD